MLRRHLVLYGSRLVVGTRSVVQAPQQSARGGALRHMGGGKRNTVQSRHSKHLHISAREKYVLRYTRELLQASRRPHAWWRLETLLYHEHFKGWTNARLLRKIFSKPSAPYELRDDKKLGIVYVRAVLPSTSDATAVTTTVRPEARPRRRKDGGAEDVAQRPRRRFRDGSQEAAAAAPVASLPARGGATSRASSQPTPETPREDAAPRTNRTRTKQTKAKRTRKEGSRPRTKA
jgi:hypothetical protein